MFERSIRLLQAERALARGAFRSALELASHPRVAAHRRARLVVEEARRALLERARRRAGEGDLEGARRDLERAGGDATLAGELTRAEEAESDRARVEGEQRERAAALVRAGFPHRARALVADLAPAAKEDVEGEIEEACRRGGILLREVEEALAGPRPEEAIDPWRRLGRTHREKALEEDLSRRVLLAWTGPRLAEMEEGPGAWPALERLVAEEPAAAALEPVQEKAARIGRALCREAEALFDREELSSAATLLEPLRSGAAAALAPARALPLAWLVEAALLALAGRPYAALALARSLAGACPRAERWARDLTKELKEREGRPLVALRALLGGDPRRGLSLLAEAGGATAQASLSPLRRVLGEIVRTGEESLAGAAAELAEGRPGRALALLAAVREPEREREALALAAQALADIRQAGKEWGCWRAGLIRARDGAALAEAGAYLERAGRLDREAPDLEASFALQERAGRAAVQVEGAALALEKGAWERAAEGLAPEESAPPREAVMLCRRARELAARLEEAALAAGPLPAEAARVAAACRRQGHRPDPALAESPAGGGKRPERSARRVGGRVFASPGEGFILRVATAGDLLVLPRERLTVGSVSARDADLRLLARIGSRHAELVRTVSFHRGVDFRIRPVGENRVLVNGREGGEFALADGDRVRLGAVLEFRFRRPLARSATALLDLGEGFQAEGCRRVAWLKEPGWDGALSIGVGPGVHLQAREGRARLEFCLDREGRILCRSSEEISVDGRARGSRETAVELGREVESGGLSVYLDGRDPL